MLVKKIPIFQGFPDLCTVKLLSKSKLELSEFEPIFFDIETTGLSRYTTFVYLIRSVDTLSVDGRKIRRRISCPESIF